MITETRDSEAARSPWWRYGKSIALVLITGISLYVLLPSLLTVFSSWRSLRHLTWYWALASLGAEATSFALLWELDRIALRVRSWFVVASAQLSGSAVAKILPGGAATSTVVAVEILRRAGVAVGQAASSLAASTSLLTGTRLALPVLALPAILAGTPVAHGLAVSAYLGLAVVMLLIAAGVLAFAFDQPLVLTGRAVEWVLNGTVRRRRKITDLPPRLLAERDFVRATIGRRWRTAVLSAAGSTGFDFLALLCALRAVGAQPRPSLVLIAYAAAGLLALIPLTPGGLGFVEAGLVGTLTLAGISPQDALLATLTYRLVSYWLPIPTGGGAYLAFRRRYPQTRAAEIPHNVSALSDSG